LLLILVSFLLFITSALSISSENNICAETFTNNCSACHEIDRACKLLGQSQKDWTELFEYMEEMGADIPDNEKTILLDCLKKPDAGITTECKEK